MNRQAYSKAYNQQKQKLNSAIQRFAQENPQRFAELQKQALQPAPRFPSGKINLDAIILQFRNGRKHYYVTTTDCWNETHLYNELLNQPSEAAKILQQRHSCFTRRKETVTKVEPCICPLCC